MKKARHCLPETEPFNLFLSSVALHIEIKDLISKANQMSGF